MADETNEQLEALDTALADPALHQAISRGDADAREHHAALSRERWHTGPRQDTGTTERLRDPELAKRVTAGDPAARAEYERLAKAAWGSGEETGPVEVEGLRFDRAPGTEFDQNAAQGAVTAIRDMQLPDMLGQAALDAHARYAPMELGREQIVEAGQQTYDRLVQRYGAGGAERVVAAFDGVLDDLRQRNPSLHDAFTSSGAATDYGLVEQVAAWAMARR